ncbi:type IV toxin-antitoxin system AbiEi family antitoxin [Denitrificimonas caeni]|uniref:Transcriptional regulator, AbiEi antitoxin, Type IV TA system n=1 Tax=Denitrificimonas caeni TaxID=521720 RepID=A0AAE9VLG6_9GAMM|nr:hypothetical protein [Denitrificimonas caeni]WBE24240.1 hypothetical protein O6P33_07570 [Denitrificimonas caeni]
MINQSASLQPLERLYQGLDKLATPERYLFTPADMRVLVGGISEAAYRALLSRAAKGWRLERVCRGLYLYHPAKPVLGHVLFHAAARLRAHEFNYISLETALSDSGVISQIPMNWITLLSSGRTHSVDCGRWGKIEFIHTRQTAADLAAHLNYDAECRLWCASVAQAVRDMRRHQRNLDLIDWSLVDEFI